MLGSYPGRFLLVHIGDPSSNQATTLESQVIHMIQELFGQTLRLYGGCRVEIERGNARDRLGDGIGAVRGTEYLPHIPRPGDRAERRVDRQATDPAVGFLRVYRDHVI